MKKVILFFLILFVSSQVCAGEKIEIFKANEPIETTVYAIKNNNLFIYVGLGKLYQFDNGQLKKVNMSENEEVDFIDKNKITMADDASMNRWELADNKDLKLELIKGYADYSLLIIDGDKEKDISNGRYILWSLGDYFYIDKKYQKIYMFCKDLKAKKIGLYVYDINEDKFAEMYTKKMDNEKSIVYSNPIRVPKTPYLLFFGAKNQNDWGFYIQEIPEWKAEIEAKEKSKEPNKSAPEVIKTDTKYVIDGPANLRDKAKGKKIIGELADKAEVKIVSQKGDWYEVESADIKGWTFKDNIKEVK